MPNQEPDLYEYLREQCPTLAAAKRWMYAWASEKDQVLPWDKEPRYTARAMAGHLSNVLEGGDVNSGYALGGMSYMQTRYGSELYFAAWTRPEEEAPSVRTQVPAAQEGLTQ